MCLLQMYNININITVCVFLSPLTILLLFFLPSKWGKTFGFRLCLFYRLCTRKNSFEYKNFIETKIYGIHRRTSTIENCSVYLSNGTWTVPALYYVHFWKLHVYFCCVYRNAYILRRLKYCNLNHFTIEYNCILCRTWKINTMTFPSHWIGTIKIFTICLTYNFSTINPLKQIYNIKYTF